MLKDLFLLDPEVVFLNHGSFGACPKPVLEAYQAWQRRLERQPVNFLAVELPELLEQVRRVLGAYLNASPQDLVLIPNATYGVNIVARSLQLGPGDEVLTSDHEYGACDKTWTYLCERSGATYRRQKISLPISSPAEIVEQLWSGVSALTRVIFFSHYTSPTAIIFPAAEICARARQAGILTLVDGAHAPGQLPLDLEEIGADFYTGNCHKWMMAPKGSAFLHAQPDAQRLLEPLVVSWGWQPSDEFTSGSRFIDLFQWAGTRDPAAHLATPAAIEFMKEHGWERLQETCHTLLTGAIQQACRLTGLEDIYAGNCSLYRQMACLPVPAGWNLQELKKAMYNSRHIEIPVVQWNEHKFLRLSLQGYNSPHDVDILLEAINEQLTLTKDGF